MNYFIYNSILVLVLVLPLLVLLLNEYRGEMEKYKENEETKDRERKKEMHTNIILKVTCNIVLFPLFFFFSLSVPTQICFRPNNRFHVIFIHIYFGYIDIFTYVS